MKFVLDIQLFASKKGVGSTKNGRDSESKRLGAKLAEWTVLPCRKYHLPPAWYENSPGTNVGKGGDDTLFAKVNGVENTNVR